ncbi:MAG: hypothetical protein LAP13_22815 [Acidobacteriia bacterium]|nr:hypothetical protein [Terriglobia bacterium]
MPEQGFPLPGSSYKELIKIIMGYRQVGQEAVPSDVAKLIGMHHTIVSRNNRFLVAVGVVQGGKKKTITPAGAELALALEYNAEDQIRVKWRAIVDSSDFLQKVVAAVRIRKSMDESSLETHVAYSAGQPKTPGVVTGAGTIVEILKVAGALLEEGGNLVAATTEATKSLEIPQEPRPYPHGPSSTGVLPVRADLAVTGGVHLNIEVRIQCTPSELDGLGEKLRKVVDDFNRNELRGGSVAPPTDSGTESE